MTELTFKQKLCSFILKIIIILSAIIGIILSANASSTEFMGGGSVFMYFTIQSNILIALISFIGLIMMVLKVNIKYYWHVIKFVGTISITLTGVVFTVVLAPTLGSGAWVLSNVLTHVVVPLASIIDFFIVEISYKIKKRDIIFVIIPPLLYAIYAGIGYALNFEFSKDTNYPYFFLNWGSKAGAIGFSNELPFMGPVWWIIILLAFLILIGFCYLKIIDLIQKKRNNKNEA